MSSSFRKRLESIEENELNEIMSSLEDVIDNDKNNDDVGNNDKGRKKDLKTDNDNENNQNKNKSEIDEIDDIFLQNLMRINSNEYNDYTSDENTTDEELSVFSNSSFSSLLSVKSSNKTSDKTQSDTKPNRSRQNNHQDNVIMDRQEQDQQQLYQQKEEDGPRPKQTPEQQRQQLLSLQQRMEQFEKLQQEKFESQKVDIGRKLSNILVDDPKRKLPPTVRTSMEPTAAYASAHSQDLTGPTWRLPKPSSYLVLARLSFLPAAAKGKGRVYFRIYE